MSEHIERCPFCEQEATAHKISIDGKWAITCNDGSCSYWSATKRHKADAIALHNEHCRKLRFAEKVKPILASIAKAFTFGRDPTWPRGGALELQVRAALKLLEGDDAETQTTK